MSDSKKPIKIDVEQVQTSPETSPASPENLSVVKESKLKLFLRSLRPENIFPKFLRTKLGKFARPVSILIIVVVLAGIGGAGYALTHKTKKLNAISHFAAKPQPFRVVASSPADSQQNVDLNTKITVTFNEPVTPQKIQNDFFVTPKVDGDFSQGQNNRQVVFTPKIPFSENQIINVMIHGEFKSNYGNALGTDYFLSFSTSISAQGVVFETDNLYTQLISMAEGQTKKFTLQVGDGVDPNGSITVYKTTVDKLLNSFIYGDKKSEDGYVYSDFINGSIDTSGMTEVDTINGLNNDQTFDFNRSQGVYVLIANSKGKQAGWTYVVVNNNGILLRQDDQKIVLTSRDLNSGEAVNANVKLYNLKDDVNLIGTKSLDGLADEYDQAYQPQLDMIVGTVGQDEIVVPVAIKDSLGDLRVNSDLSKTLSTYGITDRPTYRVGETANYASFIRMDNDAAFTSAAGQQIKITVENANTGDVLYYENKAIDSQGRVSGQIPISKIFASQDGSNNFISVYAQLADQDKQLLTSFYVEGTTPSTNSLIVSFDKKDYMPTENVTAQVIAVDKDGHPLANKSITVNIYNKEYFENDPSSNLESEGYVGDLISPDGGTKVQLDNSGKASIPIDLSKLPAAQSQQVTVQASLQDGSGHTAVAGSSTIIHQGNVMIRFGTARTVFSAGQELIARPYVEYLDGKPAAKMPIEYKIVKQTWDDSTQTNVEETLDTGSATTDDTGLAYITSKAKTEANDSIVLYVDTKDSNSNKVEALAYFYIASDQDTGVYSDLQLNKLDISGSDGYTRVGDNLNLKINAPQDMDVLVTNERGRIYSYEILHLEQGDNDYTIPIDDSLAPSFSLSFSFFLNGQYHHEGTSFNVDTQQKRGQTSISSDKSSYSVGDTAKLTIDTTNGYGAKVASPFMIGVVDESAFAINSELAPDIFYTWYGTRGITTNGSSSLLGIGTGGGGCGDGGGLGSDFTNPSSTLLYWNASNATDSNGHAIVNVPLTKKGKYRIYVYSMSDGNVVSSQTATINVN